MENFCLFLVLIVILGVFAYIMSKYYHEWKRCRKAESRLSIIDAAVKGRVEDVFYELDRAYIEDIDDPLVADVLTRLMAKELEGLELLKEFMVRMKLIAPKKVELLNRLMASVYQAKSSNFWSSFYLEAVMAKDAEAKAWIIGTISSLGVFSETLILTMIIAELDNKKKGNCGTSFSSYLEAEKRKVNAILDQASEIDEH